MGGSLTTIVTFVIKHFGRYSRHLRYLGCLLLENFKPFKFYWRIRYPRILTVIVNFIIESAFSKGPGSPFSVDSLSVPGQLCKVCPGKSSNTDVLFMNLLSILK